MLELGYTVSSEEHPPGVLVDNARRAEDLGFDFVSISDHYHPWVQAQGHSPFVWAVLGAIGHATRSVDVCVGVTCPIVRAHPALIAQAAATTALLTEGRFVLGLGTGEALNEHILGHRWPIPEVRLDMLEEAVEVIRRLWTGETVDFAGRFYKVENARIFDLPPILPPIVVSGFGTSAAELAGRIGDGYWGHSPEREVIDAYERSGGTSPLFAQLNVCWAPDVESARRTVYEIWPNGAIPGQLSQDLPTWTHFEQATQLVDEDKATSSVPCGPDVTGELLDTVREYRKAGYDHLYFHQIGPDQDGFFHYWQTELQPALDDVA
jgi:coenzyme F420-dependent glucose-6-phosphate dehydrogenase